MQGRSDRLPAAAAQPTSAPRTGRRVGCAAALLAASFLMAALSSGARADQVITNGGFETGTLAGWNAGIRPDRANGGMPYLFNTPSGWLVSNQTQTDGTLSLAPINGSSAFNGFEGSPAGLQFFLNQGFTFNSVLHDALLSFTFDIVGGPQAKGALGRRFEVWITSMSGHDRAKLFSYTITETDANPKQKVSMNIRSALNTLGPSAYMLEFREVIPEGNSGPALFVLDDVSLDLTQNSCPK